MTMKTILKGMKDIMTKSIRYITLQRILNKKSSTGHRLTGCTVKIKDRAS